MDITIKGLFTSVALLAVTVVYAGGHSGTHYGKAKAITTGNGTVYVELLSTTTHTVHTASTESQSTENSESYVIFHCGENEGDDHHSASVKYTATPQNGYQFAGWNAASNATSWTITDNPYTTTAPNGDNNNDKEPSKAEVTTLYAYFVPVFYFEAPITEVEGGHFTTSIEDERVVGTAINQTSASTNITFTAVADEGYNFAGWYENETYSGSSISNEVTYTIEDVENSEPGSTTTIYLYPKFEDKEVPIITWRANPTMGALTSVSPVCSSSNTDDLCPISFSSSDATIADVDDNTLNAYKEGVVYITVTQPSNDTYASISQRYMVTVTSAAPIINWLENSTPSAGTYYLYNLGTNQFCQMDLNNSGFPATTSDIANATPFTISGTSSTDIAYTIGNTTYYLYQNAGTYSENTYPYTGDGGIGDKYAWNISAYNDSYYQIHSNHKYNTEWFTTAHREDTERYIVAQGSNSDCVCSKNSNEYNTASGSWVFVSEGEYAAYRAYLSATEVLTADNHLSASIKGPLATIVATKTKGTDDYATWTSTLISLTDRCATYVDNLEDDPVSFNQDASGNGYYMFYNASKNIRLGDDVEAYTASWSGNNLELTAVNQVIPAGTVALVYSKTTDVFYYAEETATSFSGSNAFTHHTNEMVEARDGHKDYILTAQRDGESITGYAFAKFTGSNHSLLNDHNVLVWSAPTPAPSLIRIFEEENTPTALIPVYEDESTEYKPQENSQIYTILGIPVSDMSRPGIYIQNGKKYIVH